MTARVLDVQEIVDACADFMSSLIDDHNLLEGTGLAISPENVDSEFFLRLTRVYLVSGTNSNGTSKHSFRRFRIIQFI